MKKISIIAQFPMPMHGLSKAVDTLFNSRLKNKYVFRKVNTTNNKKFIYNLVKILFSNDDIYYITIAQSKWGNLRDLIFLAIIELKKKKVIIHLHGGYFRELFNCKLNKWQKLLNINLFKRVDKAIVLGESLKYIFEGIIDENKVEVIANCVDDEFLIEKDDIDLRYKKNDKLVVLYLSNFIEEKGYKNLLKIAKEINKDNIKNIIFKFAGKFFDYKSESEFLQYIDRNNLSDIVKYEGVVLGNNKKILLQESDVFVLLTKYHKEGQPISILEAMANGGVILTTNHAGIPDIVKDGVNGYIYEFEDIEKVKSRLIDIYNNKIYYKKMALLNNEVVRKLYTKKEYINNFEKLFDDILVL